MTYVKVSVPKPGTNAGVGGDKKSLITFFDFDDVQIFPPRSYRDVIINSNIVFKEGAYMIQIYASTNSIKITQETEGDVDARGVLQYLEFSHPGSSNNIEEFLTYWVSRDIGCIVENCSTGKKRQLGTPCAPLMLEISSEDSIDVNKSTLKLKSKNKSQYRIADYQGILTFEEATDTITPDTISIDLSSGEGRYQLTDNTHPTVITTCSNAVDGMVFTLLGSGGDEPATITKANDFILASGTTWTGIAGATITFKAFKSDSAAFSFIEISRS